MAEYGCNTNTRTFQEVGTLYSTQMSPVYSGGIAYEYSSQANGYGLVDASDEPNQDFMALAKQLKATSNPTGLAGASPNAGASKCPAYNSDTWNVPNMTLPAPPTNIKQYMTKGAGTGPGLTKAAGSSQYGGSSAADSSYSQDWIQMDGSQPTGTASSGGSSSTDQNAASGLTLGASAVVVMIASVMGALLL